MLRTAESAAIGPLLKETADALKNDVPSVDPYALHTTAKTVDESKIVEEIRALERKVEEVTEILCRASLSYMVRFQLKDDLEYYNEIIARKRRMLAS